MGVKETREQYGYLYLVVYGHSSLSICGGSRGSDHCACLTGSDVTGSHVTFPRIFVPVLFQIFCSSIVINTVIVAARTFES
jgi:hypothetical protein